MARKHQFVLVVVLAAAALAGALALSRTVRLGAPTPSVSDSQVAARSQALDRMEASLRRSLARKPPALPARPRLAPAAQRVVFVRQAPPPVASGREDDESEAEHASEHEDRGGDD